MDNIYDPSTATGSPDIGAAVPAAVTPPQPLNAVPEPSRSEAIEAIDAEIDTVEEAVRAAVESAIADDAAAPIESSEATAAVESVTESALAATEKKIESVLYAIKNAVSPESRNADNAAANHALETPFITHAEVMFTEDVAPASLADANDQDTISLAVDAQQLLSAANGHDVAASDGIEILVRLAQKGEIDPKNVDIIDVTDKFLKLIAAAPKENLRQSGKILFHACVLLRMKAEALLNFTAEDPVGDDFIDFDEEGGLGYDSDQPRQITLKDLERAIVRRSQKRQVRKRQVTLEELIEALREAERIEKSRAERKPPRAVIELAGQHDVDCVDDLLDLAHDEDVETTIVQVENLLARILKLGERIDLMRMVSLMEGHKDWVDGFLASLFLSNAGKIDLYQDEFYGPLFIGLGGSPVSDTVVT